jgi:hypothetical protein
MLLKDTTILIQGKVDDLVYDFYLKNYKNTLIVISTWEDCLLDITNTASTTFLIRNKYPMDSGLQNANLQIISTLTGLSNINTKYTIKIRGDETYSNLKYVQSCLLENDNILYTTPIFFRKWKHGPYHISDHMIAGLTSNLFNMFNLANLNYNSENYDYKNTIELLLGKSYIESCENKILDFEEDNVKYMEKYYSILNLEKLKPYKIVANCYKKTWHNDFTPENEGSISDISQINTIIKK